MTDIKKARLAEQNELLYISHYNAKLILMLIFQLFILGQCVLVLA